MKIFKGLLSYPSEIIFINCHFSRAVRSLKIMNLHLHLCFKVPTSTSKIIQQRDVCISESSCHLPSWTQLSSGLSFEYNSFHKTFIYLDSHYTESSRGRLATQSHSWVKWKLAVLSPGPKVVLRHKKSGLSNASSSRAVNGIPTESTDNRVP